MLGRTSLPPRLAASRAMLAGAALLAATGSAEAKRHLRETAMAVPRIAPHGIGVALPHPLDPVEAARIRRIFAAQRNGDFATADRDSELLDTTTPLGHAMLGQILSDRYLGRFYRPSAAELSGWLIAFSDQPEARPIYQLLLRRLPKGAAAPPPPAVPKWSIQPSPTLGFGGDPAVSARTPNLALERAVRERGAAGDVDSALRLIANARRLSRAEAAQLRAELAQALFMSNNDDDALDIAKSVLEEGDTSLAAYVAGLVSWRSGRIDEARQYFEAVALSPHTTPALRAAGGFWAARAHLRLGDPDGARLWMIRAADEPSTFYGLLGRRALGIGGPMPAVLRRRRELLGEADIAAVSAAPEGLTAFALLQIGRHDRASAELRRLDARMQYNAGMQRAIGLIASKAGLRDVVLQTSGQPSVASPGVAGSAIAALQPLDGFRVDPPLIYALARVESNFDPTAVSSAGARGLMQLMPDTATSMAGDDPLDDSSLDDPETNLELGQRYVLYLAKHPAGRGDLIHMLASWNAGPGRAASWGIRDGGDPLLYIESIPIEETRVFVQRALAFSWLYAARLGLPARSLDELASGGFPRFHEAVAVSPPEPAPAPRLPRRGR